MTLHRSFLIAAGLVIAASLVNLAHGQTARSGGAPNAQLVLQMQQLAADRTTLQAENARMKKDLDDARKERDDLKKERQAVEQRSRTSAAALAQSTTQRQATEQELTQTKARMQELIAKFRETVQTLRQVESEGTAAKQNLATRDQELKVCIDRNLELYKLNSEILTHMEHESAWSRLARAEPFTQIKRARLENLIDDYKARADDQRVAPGGTVKSPAPQQAAPPMQPPAQAPAPPSATSPGEQAPTPPAEPAPEQPKGGPGG